MTVMLSDQRVFSQCVFNFAKHNLSSQNAFLNIVPLALSSVSGFLIMMLIITCVI